MKIENLSNSPNCTACGDKLTKGNWSVYEGDVKSRCRKCQSDFVRANRYKKISKGAYSHVKYLKAIASDKRPKSFLAMIRKGKATDEELAHILREVDFKRDTGDLV